MVKGKNELKCSLGFKMKSLPRLTQDALAALFKGNFSLQPDIAGGEKNMHLVKIYISGNSLVI